jgi:SAM-dependent methyltransferase
MSLTLAHESLTAAAALRAAVDLGFVDRLLAEPVTPADLAVACGTSQRGTRALLAVLEAYGLVDPCEDGRFLGTRGASVLRATIAWNDELAEVVRTGQPLRDWDTVAVAGSIYPELASVLGQVFVAAAARAADHLGPLGAARVLDVAAGGAPWSLGLAERNPEIEVTAVDLPAVIARTRRIVTERGAVGRYRFLAGDVFTVDLAGTYDVVVVGNLCHLFDARTNLRLLRRLREVVAPHGRLAVVDVMSVTDGRRPRAVAVYEMGLIVRTRRGAAHPFTAYVDWLTSSGYRGLQRVELDASTCLSLVVAELDHHDEGC